MMIYQPQISVFELVSCLSRALDLISPALANHHMQVAYIASRLAYELGYDAQQQVDIIMASATHDIGALRVEERMEALHFDDSHLRSHAEVGYRFLQGFRPLSGLADYVRYHHQAWDNGAGQEDKGIAVPEQSHLLHLADRAAILVRSDQPVLMQTERICRQIQSQSGRMFKPEQAEAFLDLSNQESFWLDIASGSIGNLLSRRFSQHLMETDLESLMDFSRFFSRIVDFRSPMNATHSSGVAVTARMLAGLCGFSDLECDLMQIAGYFHDLGKLAVSPDILEKPGRLNLQEIAIIKGHTYHTYHLLSDLRNMEMINMWASYHHERLDGQGYPFRLSARDLPLGSQIMAVADVFTAITEDRPYRKGMSKDEAIRVLKSMVQGGALNGDVVRLLLNDFAEVEAERITAQKESGREYRAIVYGQSE